MGESYLCSPQVPVFYPTYEEFKDFRKYITSIETKAREWGICKIVPPKSWRNGQPKLMEIINKVCQNELSDSCIEKPDAEGKALLDKIIISKPLEQQFEGKNGCYNQLNIVSRRKFSVYSFKKFAESDPQMSPKIKVEDTSSSFPWSKYEQLEKLYWKTLTFSPTFYGADMCGTLFPASVTDWNIGRLDNLLADLAFKIPGVNSPYLYFGMWKSSFAWHVEDLDLFSINYVHFGQPKQWFCIPPKHFKQFEDVAKKYFPDGFQRCSQFLRHKSTVISTKILEKEKVPFVRMLQKEGEIMITFPYGYHSGFNYGFNCAESVNFAFESWLEIGVHAEHCVCHGDSVKIDLENIFRTQFQQLIPKIKIPLKFCSLCQRSDLSGMISTKDNRFVHKICAQFTPGMSLLNNEQIASNLDDVPPEYFGAKCSVCKNSCGAAIPCSDSRCIRFSHAFCLKESKMLQEDSHQVYCKKHNPTKRQKLIK